jgi:hypothetical protein
MGIENPEIVRRRSFEVKVGSYIISVANEYSVKLLVEDDINGFQWKLIPGKLWKVILKTKKNSDKIYIIPVNCTNLTDFATPEYDGDVYETEGLVFSIPRKKIAEWFDKLEEIRPKVKRKPVPITPSSDGMERARHFIEVHSNRYGDS